MVRRSWYGLLLLMLLMACSRPTPTLPLATATATSTAPVLPSSPTATVELPTVLAPTDTPIPPTLEPTATGVPASPTPTPGQARPSATPNPRQLRITYPAPNQSVRCPFTVRGDFTMAPFEATYRLRIYDAAGNVLYEAPLMVQVEMGQPGSFVSVVGCNALSGRGVLEIAELSMRDGSIVVSARVALNFDFSTSGTIEVPAADEQVTLPIRLLARVGDAGQRVRVRVIWQDGSSFERAFDTLPGLDGRGFLMAVLDGEGPRTAQPARIEIYDDQDVLLARQTVQYLPADDPNTMAIKVVWIKGEEPVTATVRIPKTVAVGRAALNILLWGPPPGNPQGWTSALPTPAQVAEHRRELNPDWGEYVQLRSLTIKDGVAYADFSRELETCPCGALRGSLIIKQIQMTLLQFSTIQKVVISVEGRSEDILQP